MKKIKITDENFYYQSDIMSSKICKVLLPNEKLYSCILISDIKPPVKDTNLIFQFKLTVKLEIGDIIIHENWNKIYFIDSYDKSRRLYGIKTMDDIFKL